MEIKPDYAELKKVRMIDRLHLAVPFLEGRPERDTCISQDDITNLRIALETTKDSWEFLKLICGE